ncbi:MAG: cytochrome P450, partial [Gammaproteobacteria bacterium]|nr:cytochrome P450 [Gammaproteobacteria bacterium]
MTTTETSLRLPPGPAEAIQIDVNLATLEALQALQRQYGNFIQLRTPSGRRTYFVNDPDEIRRILVRRHVKYRKGPGFERVEMLLGNGIIVSDGDVWRRARTMVQPAFSRQNVHRLLDTMIVCCERRAERWQAVAASGGVLNITREMSEFALELILRAIFGPDYDNRILQGGENPFAFLSQDATRDLSVVMKMHKLRKFLLQVVEARKASPEVEQYDFLSMYIDATDKDGRHFSDRELIDELITLIVAGYETSAGTLNWAWYLLATHPGAEATLLAEARRLMPDRDAITIDSVTDMHYAQAMLEETLRLYPPVWLYSRRSLEADELTEYDIPPDTDIFLSPYILHRTAEFWEDPDRFEPARFGQDSAYAKGERPYF